METVGQVYNLLYSIGDILVNTWPGRLVLGMVVGSMLTKLARA